MAATAETTSYAVEGRVLEVCTCKVLCPCGVGADPDGDGTCDSIIGWYVDRGTVDGLDVSDRCLCLSVHIPGNILAGKWRAALLVDDRCDDGQLCALLDVFTGRLGGPIADLAALIGEVVAVERVPIVFEVVDGRGRIEIGDVAHARITPFLGATGLNTSLHDTAFSTIPGSPAFVARADSFRRDGRRHGLPDVAISGHNAVQGSFRFSG
jgi:hypothetical protein